jgi:hypothetical protein
VFAKEPLAHDQPENRVPKKLEALVVPGRGFPRMLVDEGTVCERLFQQKGLPE